MARTCPFDICDGSGMITDEELRVSRHCRCRDQVVAERRARGLSAVIPRRYRGLSFDRAPITDLSPSEVAPVRRFANDIAAELDRGNGLWLYGSIGSGKTSLAMLVSAAALAAGRSVAIYSLPRLLAEIRTTFEEGNNTSYVEFMERLASVDLLHIDDVGAEKTSDWVLEQLYSIVNSRYEDERSIMITTNIDHERLAEQIDARTVSRLKEMCAVVPIFGPDMRAQTGQHGRRVA
jgi:DNA replication protein DnaC